MAMTKREAEKLAKQLAHVDGVRVTGFRTEDAGASYCLDAVDTVTGIPFVITSADYLAECAKAHEDYVALGEYWEEEGQRILAEEREESTPRDFGYVTAGEMHRLMRAHPELDFFLRIDAEEDGEEAEVYTADSPEYWAWNEEQVPTDDAQREMRLEGRPR